jgi:SAM-dependent methyltransferase
VSETAFDEYIETYEAACAQGLRLAGEPRDYFARKRVEYTRQRCPEPGRVRTVIDFGCGLGHSVPYLAEAFPRCRVIGLDTAARAIESAREHYGGERAEFHCTDGFAGGPDADLVYCNGVFHHIEVADRPGEVRRIHDWMAPGGTFALWENNPWNPGTRLVMRRIPFDRDAVPLSCRETRRLLLSVGFEVVEARSFFYFPSALRVLRGLEPWLEKVPLGAQYCVWARKPTDAGAR